MGTPGKILSHKPVQGCQKALNCGKYTGEQFAKM